MSWVRNYRSPPNSLVLFQVYQRFAPITDFRGPVWRYQVEEDVCLQCHLLPAARRGSFLHIRRQPTLAITPPLLHIEGQMEAAFPDQLPLLEWLAQGTVWWLRNLGSVDVDPALRMLLFSSLLDLDQQRFPRLFEAVAYHPIVPLCDGRWISLQTLRQAPCAYLARPQQGVSLPGYVDGGPVVQHLLGFERLQEFLDQPLHPLPLLDQTPPTLPPPPAWSYSLPTTCGPALLSPLKYRDGNCLWLFREHDWYVFGPLFPGIPISLQIKVDESADRNLDHVPDKLRQAVQIALLKHGHSVLRLLPDTPQGFSTACALVKAMLDHNHAVRDDILQRCWGDGLTLQQVVLGQTSLESFSLSHPVRLLTTPENQAESEAPIHSLFRLSWSQKCSQGRAHLQFRPERDGICHWNVYYGEIQVLKHSQPLWTQWPLSLAVHFHLLNKPRQDLVLLAMDLQYSLQQSLLDGADVVLRSLCSYPDALPEICCLMGAIAKFRTGQQLPGQALDYPTEEGTLGQSLQQDLSARYPSGHPIRLLQAVVKEHRGGVKRFRSTE